MTIRILCVEDNPQNMRLVRRILKKSGYKMLEAETGGEGLSIAQNDLPDLILMDINLPDIDGIEVTRRIKSDAATAHIPIVALTANELLGDEQTYADAGFDGFIAKPVSSQKLLNGIAFHLNPTES